MVNSPCAFPSQTGTAGHSDLATIAWQFWGLVIVSIPNGDSRSFRLLCSEYSTGSGLVQGFARVSFLGDKTT